MPSSQPGITVTNWAEETGSVTSQNIPAARKRLLLADDQVEVLQELRTLLEENYEIVGEVNNGKSLVEAVVRFNPDLIISDISMPEMNGFEAAAKLRSLGLATKLIFLTVQSSSPYVRKAKALGASGYVLKVYAMEQLPEAVNTVLAGGTYISPELEAKN